ncbi:MAG: hypothetical protein K0S53_2221 [Bacteroidetes bacterium]|jgi:hypothetical protein|nr:hypothetical protein [Bacteroidota bacterium]
MKIINSLILLFLALSFTSFDKPFIAKPLNTVQATDSIPEINRQIVAYAKTKIKKKVGRGECWDFAAEALQTANAKWDMNYKFGKEIDYKKEQVFPGDIIQLEGVILNYEINGMKYTEKMMHHTAIIYEVNAQNSFMIAHQNNGFSGRKVGVSSLDLATLTKGKFTIYRPEK